MTGPELKPCPFCGVRPHLHEDASHSTAFFVHCYDYKCPVQPSAYGLSKAEAIAAWNTRAQVDYAALPEVQALIAGAMQSVADRAKTELVAAWAADLVVQWVKDVTPADAIAARDAIAAEAVAKEREACAELAASSTVPAQTAMRLAVAIRKRGEVKQ